MKHLQNQKQFKYKKEEKSAGTMKHLQNQKQFKYKKEEKSAVRFRHVMTTTNVERSQPWHNNLSTADISHFSSNEVNDGSQ